MLDLTWGGETLRLLPQKAALLPDHHMLLIADAHIGKAVSFRRLGVPVPRGTTTDNLQRLDELLGLHPVAHVVFLGDLLHSAHAHAAPTLAAFGAWRERHARLEITLVRGNHDDRAGDPPPWLGIRCVDEPLPLGGLALCHHPQPRPGRQVVAGHLHPGARLGRGLDRVRVPCFHFRAGVAVMPAFGSFTGLHPVECQPGDRLVAVADGQLFDVPNRLVPAR
ncbi:ligase-associated DNA damage response endonuclease PdeM [Aquincola sp. J276]|uniref:ligase-associated DNA damage response endonuclease PdeM n=1 Tax=Aquincola sp. J276 TaxID=2898432 RepID=UPI0021515E92|nr:ligase-associated DNA damage response endonuclease PdeM [Aquincola sp. J276]MCR5866747.1 ligase-associated DNA damage response endonuclease PdeM [Aquincola sp. J276]